MSAQSVAIVIPMYQADLSDEAKVSIAHLRQYCSEFPWVIVHPLGLTFNFDTHEFTKIALSPRHFKSVATYNRLCLNPRFYRLFAEYHYLLIAQLDTCVFKNELAYWCEQDYSYMGAPWLKLTLLSKLKRRLKGIKKHQDLITSSPLAYRWDGTGNGGFSLRKVSHFCEMLTAERVNWFELFKLSLVHKRKKIPTWKFLWCYLQAKIHHRPIGDKIRKIFTGGEDRYWPTYGKVLCQGFKTAPEPIANHFAMEWCFFEVQLALNKGITPFAGHGCLGEVAKAMWAKKVVFLKPEVSETAS